MEEKTLKTSNHFIKARYDITEQELKLVVAMFYSIQERTYRNITNIDEELKASIEPIEPVTFTSQELSYWLGIDRKQYHNIKNIVKRLMSRVISIEDHDFKNFKMAHFISNAEYKDGILTIKPDEDLMKYFLFLENNFTKIPITTLLQLKNVYAIKMYNLMVAYKNIRSVISMSLEEFRILLQIEKKYTDNKNLKRFVLDLIQKELNTVIKDLDFSYHLERENRTYKRVIFKYNKEVLMKNDVYISKYFEALKKYRDDCRMGESCNFTIKDERCLYCKNLLHKRFDINLKSRI